MGSGSSKEKKNPERLSPGDENARPAALTKEEKKRAKEREKEEKRRAKEKEKEDKRLASEWRKEEKRLAKEQKKKGGAAAPAAASSGRGGKGGELRRIDSQRRFLSERRVIEDNERVEHAVRMGTTSGNAVDIDSEVADLFDENDPRPAGAVNIDDYAGTADQRTVPRFRGVASVGGRVSVVSSPDLASVPFDAVLVPSMCTMPKAGAFDGPVAWRTVAASGSTADPRTLDKCMWGGISTATCKSRKRALAAASGPVSRAQIPALPESFEEELSTLGAAMLTAHSLAGERGAKFSVFQCDSGPGADPFSAVDEFLSVVGAGAARWRYINSNNTNNNNLNNFHAISNVPTPCIALPAVGTVVGRSGGAADGSPEDIRAGVDYLIAAARNCADEYGVHVVIVCPAVTRETVRDNGKSSSSSFPLRHGETSSLNAPFPIASLQLCADMPRYFPDLTGDEIAGVGEIVRVTAGDAGGTPLKIDLYIGEDWIGSECGGDMADAFSLRNALCAAVTGTAVVEANSAEFVRVLGDRVIHPHGMCMFEHRVVEMSAEDASRAQGGKDGPRRTAQRNNGGIHPDCVTVITGVSSAVDRIAFEDALDHMRRVSDPRVVVITGVGDNTSTMERLLAAIERSGSVYAVLVLGGCEGQSKPTSFLASTRGPIVTVGSAVSGAALLSAWQLSQYTDGLIMVPGMEAALGEEARRLGVAASRFLTEVEASPPPGWLLSLPSLAPLAVMLRSWDESASMSRSEKWGPSEISQRFAGARNGFVDRDADSDDGNDVENGGNNVGRRMRRQRKQNRTGAVDIDAMTEQIGVNGGIAPLAPLSAGGRLPALGKAGPVIEAGSGRGMMSVNKSTRPIMAPIGSARGEQRHGAGAAANEATQEPRELDRRRKPKSKREISHDRREI